MGIEQKAGDMGAVTVKPGTGGELGVHQCDVADALWAGLLCN